MGLRLCSPRHFKLASMIPPLFFAARGRSSHRYSILLKLRVWSLGVLEHEGSTKFAKLNPIGIWATGGKQSLNRQELCALGKRYFEVQGTYIRSIKVAPKRCDILHGPKRRGAPRSVMASSAELGQTNFVPGNWHSRPGSRM